MNGIGCLRMQGRMSETRIRLAHTAMALFLFAGANLSTHAQEPAASTTQTPSQSGAPSASTTPSDAQAAPAAGATATFETTAEVGTRQNPMVVVESVAAQQLRKRMAVEYPQSAIHAKISGSVKMQVLIGKSGRVIATRIIWGPDALPSAAESGVSRSEYLPMTLDGKPVFMATTCVWNSRWIRTPLRPLPKAVSSSLGMVRRLTPTLYETNCLSRRSRGHQVRSS